MGNQAFIRANNYCTNYNNLQTLIKSLLNPNKIRKPFKLLCFTNSVQEGSRADAVVRAFASTKVSQVQ